MPWRSGGSLGSVGSPERIAVRDDLSGVQVETPCKGCAWSWTVAATSMSTYLGAPRDLLFRRTWRPVLYPREFLRERPAVHCFEGTPRAALVGEPEPDIPS